MDYNIIDKYVNYIRENFLKLFKIIFKSNYHKDLSLLFIDRYIEVRYFNETDYVKEKDFINRINKELIDLANEVYNDKNVDRGSLLCSVQERSGCTSWQRQSMQVLTFS